MRETGRRRPWAAVLAWIGASVLHLACSSPDGGAAGTDAGTPNDAGMDGTTTSPDASPEASPGDAMTADSSDAGTGDVATDAPATSDGGPDGVADAGDAQDVLAQDASCIDGGLGSVLQLAAGGTNTCVVRSDHTLWCWGLNDQGQVGDGTTMTRTLPVQVTALGAQVGLVTTGENQHACAVMLDQMVRCWGSNAAGTLGDGTLTNSLVPVTVLGLSGVVEIRGGSAYTCARKTDGTVWCWGDNSWGQLGDGTKTNRNTPVQVMPIGTTAAQVDVGWFHSCVRKVDETVWCWGRNSYGELGDGTFVDNTTPVAAIGVAQAARIGLGPYDACANLSDGTLWCWGYNGDGQLNDSTNTDRGAPVRIASMATSVAGTDVGFSAAWARKADHTIWYWGYGMLSGVTQVPNLLAQTLVAGDDHECVIDDAGILECWGFNGDGELGDGTTTSRATPAPVQLPCP